MKKTVIDLGIVENFFQFCGMYWEKDVLTPMTWELWKTFRGMWKTFFVKMREINIKKGGGW